MKYKIFIALFSIFILSSCDTYVKTNKISPNIIEDKYKNTGFALIFNKDLNLKKLDDRSFEIFHNSLKRKSYVKITNPLNDKSLIAQVRSNNVRFSNFYNSVISKRIADELVLDYNEPYIEIILISKNSTFIAKKTKTFEEEKTVAEKAPIDGIKISDLNLSNKTKKKLKKNNKFSYYIKVADFYYKKSAKNMSNKIKSEVKLKNIKIIELTKTNYRLLLGPFNDIQSLKDSFEKMNSLYFENLEIIKDA